MPTLKIFRDSGYADCFRAYKIILDDTEVAEIRNGETKQIPVSEGKHSLRIRIAWCGSHRKQFTVVADEDPVFQVSSNLRGLRLLLTLWHVLFARNSYLVLRQLSRG